ncbi:hypothetical protein GQR58_007619 [Nymphon striatum]|nr:hypothetical protein GQR58_007619 [Nymphon striatum]
MLSIGIPIGIPEGLLPTPEADMATTTRRFAFKNAFKQDLLGHELEHVRFIRGHVTYMVLELHSGACRKLHKQVGEVGFEDAVARALKHAPNKKGGYRFKVIEIIHCQWF